MSSLIIKEVDYGYIEQNITRITELTTTAFLENHKITQDAFQKTNGDHRSKFIDILNAYTPDTMTQVQQHGGMYFVAESYSKIVGISIGRPYGKSALSDKFIQNVFDSKCCFKEVMKGWWDLMEKYQGKPPGKIYHQATMAIDPDYAGKGIGAKICALTAKRILEMGYDGYATETSSNSADQLAEKMKKNFKVIDLDSNGAGLTLRLHLQPNALSETIHQWFLAKNDVQAVAKDIDVRQISTVGVHYHVGNIAVWDSNPNSKQPVLVMLHPNSLSRLCFKKQMEDHRLTDHYRLIALDLPAHGDSKVVENPKATYTFQGYAGVVTQTLHELNVQDFVLLGHSLGGHVVLEAMNQAPGIKGIILTGTPPVVVSDEGFKRGFKEISIEIAKLMSKRHFTRNEAAEFASAVGNEPWMVEYALKTDGRARQRLMEWIHEGVGGDQRKLVEETKLPTALIFGDNDLVDIEYLKSLKYGNLWAMRIIKNGDHGVIYKKSSIYNGILLEFLNSIYT